jgi:hypothetical protein
MTRYLLALLFVVLAACDSTTIVHVVPDAGLETDTGVDLGPLDSGTDAGFDAGVDAGPTDAGVDLGTPDTGHPCECSAGPCCDGCRVRPSTYQCVTNGPVRSACTMGAGLPPLCSGTTRITITNGDRWCDGVRPDCRGRIDTTNATPRSVNDACTYDAALYDVVVCRADGSELGASCSSWCEAP